MTAAITRRQLAQLAGGGVVALLAPRIATARFPDRPIRIMVGFAPGGTVDTIARVLAQALTPLLGQQVVVENRPGASASLAASAVVRSEADGHALLFGVFSHAVAPALAHLTYDTLADLTAVDVQILWDTPQPATRSFIDQGQLRALAVMGRTRLAAYPEIAVIGEAGLGDDLEVQAWQGVLVKNGTPDDVIVQLHRAIVAAMTLPETRARIEALAVEPMATDPAAFGAFFRAEVLRWTEVARRAGITTQ